MRRVLGLSLLQLVAVGFSLLPTIAVTQQTSPAPTPAATDDCVAWVDRCTGEHHCAAGGSNSTMTPPPFSCYPLIPADLTPAPGVCTLRNGSCQFVDPCATWNKQCFGTDYQCTTKEQYQYHNCSSFYQPNPPPPPKEKCLVINGTCQEYNPCRKRPGFCNGPYQCITDVQYYQYTHGPQPGCPPPPSNTPQPLQIPPGECIYQNVSGPVSISFLVISVYLVLDCYFQIVQHGLMFAQVPHGPVLHTMIWRLTGAFLLHHALLLLTLGRLITYHSLDHAITALLLRNATT